MYRARESMKEESDIFFFFYNNGEIGNKEPSGPLRSFGLQDKERKKILEKLSVIFINQKSPTLSSLERTITTTKNHTRASKKATAKTKMQGE